MAEVGLLIERSLGETEGVHDVVDLESTVLDTLISFLGGGIGTSVYEDVLAYALESRKRLATH
jgi:hypothetical protein